ncbi:uncharacterized protein LOC131664226 [Phymastichus coffea]|uniref:uncharacterized protein LOC131664226 n=1 Tax=Phymastichus coffea TaxID=108790 RepID=UPI00273C77FE|nr:uncharacterized protein LOC131664226 [Phymastichus coffea]XP_058791135.1 uncharacterized protein LOC131664226 [Phymastichus coffea]
MPKKVEKSADKVRSRKKFSMSIKNGRRWTSLKNHLGILTDDELIEYLLALADSVIDQESKNSHGNVELHKEQCIQENNVQSNFIQSLDSRVLNNNLQRRSPRKFNIDDFSKSACCEKSKNVSCSLHSVGKLNQQEQKGSSKFHLGITRTKRHTNKSKCHRDKFKKKYQKIEDTNSLATTGNKIIHRVTLKLDLENSSMNKSSDLLAKSETENIGNQYSKDSNKNSSVKLPSSENLEIDLQYSSTPNITKNGCNNIESLNNFQPSELTQPLTVSVKNLTKNLIENEDIPNSNGLNNSYENKKESNKQALSEESDKAYLTDQISSTCDSDDEKYQETTNITKRFDVSKTSQNDVITYTHTEMTPPLVDSKSEDNSYVIKVDTGASTLVNKVCKICNSMHSQDACTVMKPEYIIEDSISLLNWINKYKNNSEVVNIIDSNEPMSKGYCNGENYIFEPSEERVKQYDAKCDIQYEEKQENIYPERPLYSRESLPYCLELKMSNMDHGLGVFTKNSLPVHTQFGPLIGQFIQEMDIPDDYSMKHIWPVSTNNKTQYISTTNPLKSNWIRYIRPSETEDSKNVNIVKKNDQLFIITCKMLKAGTELIYWLDSYSDSWTRKNKMDKMNCGGCNLKFSHPIYYRLHCCIFHDTNYSLTIRKYHCKVCGAAVLGKDNIMKHAAQFHAGRGAYQCQYCKKFFLRLNYLEMHRTYGCSKNPQRSRPLCDFCGRKFCQPQKLKVHIKRMHSDASEVLEEFQCKLCSKLLGSRAALQRHMKEVHHKDVVGAAACDRCGKTFQNKSNLKIHMLTHSGVKPFKCKENECKAAFTTKQCLQFHYKKVHGLSDEKMPKIERSIAYTFDAYSGGLVEDLGRGRIPKFNSNEKEEYNNSFELEDDDTDKSQDAVMSSSRKLRKRNKKVAKEPSSTELNRLETVESSAESAETNSDIHDRECTTEEIDKVDKQWTNKLDTESTAVLSPETFNIDTIQSNVQENGEAPSAYPIVTNEEKLETPSCKRQESYNASLLVEAALDAAERDIGVVSIPSLEDNDQANADLYSVPNELGFKSTDYQVAHEPNSSNVDSFVNDELVMAPAVIPHARQALTMNAQYRSSGYVSMPSRLHGIEQYLEQEILTSPRYDEVNSFHSNANFQIPPQPHRLTVDPISSNDSDSAVQNLSLSVKDKNIQQIETSKFDYKPDYNLVSKARVKFEPLVVQSAREQGLDMSARGYQRTSESQMQNSNHLHHYHHHHHNPYKTDENERHGVDLSISAPCVSPSYTSIYPSYPHVDVSRVVNLEPTSRSHQLHTAVSRIIASPLPETLLTSFSSDTTEVRVLPSSPSPISTYNTSSYSIGTGYHTTRSGYHYCNYY